MKHFLRTFIIVAAVHIAFSPCLAALISFKAEQLEENIIRETLSFVLDEPTTYTVSDYTVVNQVVVEFPGNVASIGELRLEAMNSALVERISSYRGNIIIHLRHVPVEISDTFDQDPFMIQVTLEGDKRRITQVQDNMRQLRRSLAGELELEFSTKTPVAGISGHTPLVTGLTPEELLQLELRSSALSMIDPYREDRGLRELNTPDAMALRRGLENINSGQYLDALDDLLYIIRQHPQSPFVEEATFLLGDCYRNISQEPPGLQYRDAIAVYEKAMELYPNSRYIPKAMFGIAQSYENLNNRSTAKYYYEMIAELPTINEYIGPALLSASRLELEMNDPEAAIQAVERLLDYDEDHWRMEAYQRLTSLHHMEGDYQESARFFTRLQEEYPEFGTYEPELLLEAARSYYRTGQLRESAHNLQKIINVYPAYDDAAAAYLKLATIHFDVGNLDLSQMYISELTGQFSQSEDAARGQLLQARILKELDLCDDALGMYSLVEFGSYGRTLEQPILKGKVRGEICLGNFDIAESLARQFLSRFGLSDKADVVQSLQHEARYRRARQKYEENDIQESYDLLRSYIQEQIQLPDDEENYQRIIDLAERNYYLLGEIQLEESSTAALEHFREFLNRYPDGDFSEDVQRHIRDLEYRLTHEEIEALQFQQAIERAQSAVEEFDSGYRSSDFRDLQVYTLFKQGEFLFNNGNYDEGSVYFDRIFHDFDDTPYAEQARDFLIRAGRGNVFEAYSSSDYVAAVDQFNIYSDYLVHSHEDYFESGKMASQSYTRLGFYDRGMEHIDEMEKNLPAAYSDRLEDLRALNYWGLQDYQRLIGVLGPRLASGEPMMPEAYRVLAQSYSRENQTDEAIDTYLSAADALAENDPQNSRHMRFDAAQLLQNSGREDEAREQYEQLVGEYELNPSLDPVVVDAYYELVEMARRSESHQRVVELCQQVLDLIGNDHDQTLHFLDRKARAYQGQGDIARAIPVYERIVEQDPDGPFGLRARQELQSYQWNERVRERLQ
ncbi:tetratricopeptide repeat protein [Desulfurispira natronophila]|uniref:Tetratricopeptide (TPR) repeat protein n=1 Tax=Desulfurispira natronophila TaxID=682562 RepID=A0A7W7Y3M3_9BACT|nr:tetratricopeptide repeat protein [Desulfurispira natronophila]MBB5021486.1 tetratricopeptide (TPR) repeat protein [Desulfurispira natronophila]